MKIYPNPARSTTYVSVPSDMKEKGKMIVRNNVGAIIEKRSYSLNDSRLLSLDLTSHPTGMYNVELTDGSMEVSSDLLNLVSCN
jgi:hypothetical protein